ncbi:MAG: MFS transporter [Solirubrobacteraceae bacterium]
MAARATAAAARATARITRAAGGVARDAIHAAGAHISERAHREAGGPIRLRVVVLFACVYGLSSADTGTVGAVAPQLESTLHITNTQIGVIAAVAALAGAAGTIPAGVLTDRFNRIALLSASIVLWSVAMLASAFAPSFLALVLTRVGLGAVTATSGPTVASLTGDYFPARERARMLGLILTGELLGSGIGVVVSGDLASVSSWRLGFGWLALPGIALAIAIWRMLVEPARGGQSRLEPGAEEFVRPTQRGRRARRGPQAAPDPAVAPESEQEIVRDVAQRLHVKPDPELVLDRDPARMRIGDAVRYVLRIPTNLVLIISSALAYLFFAGVQTFAVVLMRSRYGLSEGAATSLLIVIGLGAIAGIVIAGQVADRLLHRGRLNARVLVAAVGYIAAPLIFIPGLLSPVLLISLPLFAIAAGALAAADPPLQAARLDVMHPGLWGRAEGVRTVLHMLTFAVAPIVFGFISDQLGGHGVQSAAIGGGSANGQAVAYTFLIMLVPVIIAGILLLRAMRTYPRDVATASASVERTFKRPADAPTGGGGDG